MYRRSERTSKPASKKGQKGPELKTLKEIEEKTPEGGKGDTPVTSKKGMPGMSKDETPRLRTEVMPSTSKEEIRSARGSEDLGKEGGEERERDGEIEKREYDAAYTYGDLTVKEVHERMILTVAKSSCTVEEKESLLEDIGTIVSLFRKQQAHTQFVRGMLHEKKKEKDLISETYADRARVRSRSRSRSAKRDEKGLHVITIVPREEQNAEVTRTDIQNEISPTKMKVGIKAFRKISKGGMLIGTETVQDIDRIIEEVRSNDKLMEKYKVEKPRKRRPQIIIYGVTEELEMEELKSMIKEQNVELEEGEIQMITKFKVRGGENVILSLNGESFKKIMKTKKIKIGWNRYSIKEYLRPKICFNCFRIGHIAKVCLNNRICRDCGEDYHEGDCKKELTCVNCKFFNSKNENKVEIRHAPTAMTCTRYSTEVSRLIGRTDYGP